MQKYKIQSWEFEERTRYFLTTSSATKATKKDRHVLRNLQNNQIQQFMAAH